ncbi:DUF1353 domain-containing protein [Bradyrhizobium elkanii]|uniref:DUF1353 domain-containing protein n=1 Tax=Bradyrhizobium elkanii TaxID=29448 RepID=UPI002166DEE3|nr:DUF1353 domain-containing protein [Bradyrhizobium elkanii]MCS3689390.1 hypothetical protein [Bradyrhizobium elkanii]
MAGMDRRQFCALAAGIGATIAAGGHCRQAGAAVPQGTAADRWMNRALAKQTSPAEAAVGVLFMGRFRDPMYFLTSPISWHPDSGQSGYLAPIEVPKGFVTDLASIPRVFWSLLRPDGEYAHAAVIHDYLYWTQLRPRDVADEILRRDMHDLHVDRSTVTKIHAAVRTFGGSAWDSNAVLKASGEKRILRIFPDDPSILWSDWKKRPDVFT